MIFLLIDTMIFLFIDTMFPLILPNQPQQNPSLLLEPSAIIGRLMAQLTSLRMWQDKSDLDGHLADTTDFKCHRVDLLLFLFDEERDWMFEGVLGHFLGWYCFWGYLCWKVRIRTKVSIWRGKRGGGRFRWVSKMLQYEKPQSNHLFDQRTLKILNLQRKFKKSNLINPLQNQITVVLIYFLYF